MTAVELGWPEGLAGRIVFGDNLAALAQAAQGLAGLLRVDLLSYNKAAGGKYRAAGMVWRPDFDESRPLNLNTALFEAARVKVCIP